MKITILTLFPDMIHGFLNERIVKRAQEKGAVEIDVVQLRDFAIDSYKTVDDRPYGGGAGMVLMAEPIVKALQQARSSSQSQEKSRVILTSARGNKYTQNTAKKLSQYNHLMIIAGHYEAVDERITDHIDEEISIGDFILTGGELPAAIIIDSIVRLLPGVLKKQEATEIESFFEVSIDELVQAIGENPLLAGLKSAGIKKVKLLEYPHYTRPQEFEGKQVPEVLLSGDPKKIRQWQLQQAFSKTKSARPDLLKP